MLVPQTQGAVASSSSPAISQLTEDDSDALPPPAPHILLETEITALRALIAQVHVRLQTARGITEADEGVQLSAWLATEECRLCYGHLTTSFCPDTRGATWSERFVWAQSGHRPL